MSGCASTNTLKSDSESETMDLKTHVEKNDLAVANHSEKKASHVNMPMSKMDNSNAYIVKYGDTLSGIAAKQVMTFKGYLKCLEEVNDLTDKSVLKIGEKLTIPSIKECKEKGIH